jgi:hypothetical protein
VPDDHTCELRRKCVGGKLSVHCRFSGTRESCVVTRVLPYAPEEGDLKQPTP